MTGNKMAASIAAGHDGVGSAGPLGTADGAGTSAAEPNALDSGAPDTAGLDPMGPDRLAAELRVAIMRTSRRLRTEASGELLKPAQYSVLVALNHGDLTIGQLAKREMVAAPSMTRIVQHLEEAGWTSRQPHPDDARQVVVSITAAGREILERARAHRTAWLALRLGELDAADRRTLARAAELLQGMCSA